MAPGPSSGVPVWSIEWFSSVARLAAVGLGSGALAGAALGVLVVLLGPGSLLEAGGPLLIGLVLGASSALPVILLSAVTGLVVAARAPQRRAVTLGLLLVWPLAITALAVSFFARDEEYGPVPSLVGVTTLLVLVAAAVLLTSRWVTAPLRRAVNDQQWSEGR